MSRIPVRLDRVLASRSELVAKPVRMLDLTKLTPDQRRDLDRLDERLLAVGIDGLTGAEMEECARLVGILEAEAPA